MEDSSMPIFTFRREIKDPETDQHLRYYEFQATDVEEARVIVKKNPATFRKGELLVADTIEKGVVLNGTSSMIPIKKSETPPYEWGDKSEPGVVETAHEQ
jgi:hypothetical protein